MVALKVKCWDLSADTLLRRLRFELEHAQMTEPNEHGVRQLVLTQYGRDHVLAQLAVAAEQSRRTREANARLLQLLCDQRPLVLSRLVLRCELWIGRLLAML